MSKNGQIMHDVEARLDQLKETFSSLGDSLGDAKDEVQDRGEAVLKNVKRLVKANPMAAIGIALGAGIVITMILRRR